ncbi:cold shock domain-containing protein [Rhodanobacter soli]|uniref:cold shock domain-containing protein n=1 Tax=Rhodanobacter soli TaxID=590609 RepID=UPI0031DC867B
MRTHGTLTQWNDDRGFGFIEPTHGTEEIFVHVSAFPRDGIHPRIGELVSFEIDLRGDGKKRALRVMRPGSRATPHRARRPPSMPTRQSPLTAVVSLLLLAVIGWYGYSRLAKERTPPATPTPHAIRAMPVAPAQPYACDGRTRCSQMTSCAEATFFIKQCPGTQMDGDGDGSPCESQWCNSERVD